MDRFASVVNSIHAKQTSAHCEAPSQDTDTASTTTSESEPASPKHDEFQYKRAYRLSMDLKDSLVVLTNEQIKQIQEHNILV